ncbi:helix-turn-helix transcriptional regulator [[Limnothrix rosea] IAM M-220]|uniref:helix-turn-helix transcriptional regulator n=1 Tax=[Limnothrix rosea] IAM M-220 TaxID=454133 RepID=UPI000966C7FE|nr:WYL domain-containing protein [[Limnothrix rosea] IAM M-220]OKH15964.1 hypothetical protein NIES208_12345 [[Limnothrix rosea] IAM M-220]
MPKVSQSHSYSDQKSLERLLILIAVMVRYPGVGCPDPDSWGEKIEHHNALAEVREKWQEIAAQLGINFKPNYPAIATLRKDLSFLRQYGILEHRMYRWGYYLGTGVFTVEDLQLALNSMGAIAHDQGDFRYRQTLNKIQKYLRGFDFGQTDPDYPIRQNLNRPVNWTDPEIMMEQGEYRKTLFHHLKTVEQAIWQGQAIEISRHSSPYNGKHLGTHIVIPLQLIFYNVAWYLLYEDCKNHCFVIGRMNRFTDYCEIITQQGRGLAAQRENLNQAQRLLNNGWGLNLGNEQEQIQERLGKLPFTDIKVRFFHPASRMILEAEQRHPSQQLRRGKKNPDTGQPKFVDYRVILPPRSIPEFMTWVMKYGGNVKVLSPPDLVDTHRQAAQKLAQRYDLL